MFAAFDLNKEENSKGIEATIQFPELKKIDFWTFFWKLKIWFNFVSQFPNWFSTRMLQHREPLSEWIDKNHSKFNFKRFSLQKKYHKVLKLKKIDYFFTWRKKIWKSTVLIKFLQNLAWLIFTNINDLTKPRNLKNTGIKKNPLFI